MPNIHIRYGPYLCHGTIDYRIQKVNGLFSKLFPSYNLHLEVEDEKVAFLMLRAISTRAPSVVLAHITSLLHKIPVIEALSELGYKIELVPINDYNRLSIVMDEREVFRCDIRNLMFNIPMEDDPICQRAVKAVEEAKKRMDVEQNVPEYGPIAKGVRRLSSSARKERMEQAIPPGTELPSEISDSRSLGVLTESQEWPKSEEKANKVKIMDSKTEELHTKYEEVCYK